MSHKLEVGERRSLASHYTLTAVCTCRSVYVVYQRSCRRRRRRNGSLEDRSQVSTKKSLSQQSTVLSDGEVPPNSGPLDMGGNDSDQGGGASVPSLSSRVPVITVDRWAVRPQPWLHANTAAKPPQVTGSKVMRSKVIGSRVKRSQIRLEVTRSKAIRSKVRGHWSQVKRS